jgi:hypothetical protein
LYNSGSTLLKQIRYALHASQTVRCPPRLALMLDHNPEVDEDNSRHTRRKKRERVEPP